MMGSNDSLLEKLIFSSKEHGRIIFHETSRIGEAPGAVSMSASGKFGTLEFNEVPGDGYSFRFGFFQIVEETTLTTILDMPYLGLFINQGNDIEYSQEGIRPGVFRNGYCSIISLPYVHIKSKLMSGSYLVFDICFSPEYIRQWENSFKSLSRILSRVRNEIPMFENFELPNGARGVTEMVKDLEHVALNNEDIKSHKTAKVNELLFMLFDQYECEASAIVLHEADIEKLHEVRNLLLEHPGTMVSLKKLAHHVGMNEFKLKRGFKKLFGSPVYGFFLEERMKKAKALLAEGNLPVSEIASLIGYKNVSSFSAAFRKRFGYPPSAAR